MNSNQPQPNKFTYPLEIRGVETNVLFNSPDGWLKTNIKYGRSKQYGGVMRSLTLPIKYVNEGSRLVRREFIKYRLMARVNQRILLNDPLTYENSQLFFGKLDFSKYQDEPTGVSITLTENNINNQIAAYGDQQYSIPLNVNETARTSWINTRGYDPMVDILLTPLQLQESANLIFNTSPDFRMNAFFEIGIADYQQMSLNPSVKQVGFLFQGPLNLADPTAAGYNFFEAQTDTTIRISSPLNAVTGLPIPGGVGTSINGPGGGGTGVYEFAIYNQTGAKLKVLATSPPVIGTVQFDFSFDFSLNVAKGDKLYFYIKNLLAPALDDGNDHGVNMQRGSMRLTYYTSTAASHCQALRPEYVFDYLIQTMNGTDNPAVITQSRLLGLNGPLFQACITCSNAILTSQAFTVYQEGDPLQYGNTYKVYGGVVRYYTTSGLARDYNPGEIFKAILPFPTFSTDPDEDGFVIQESNNPQILLSYNTFFKAIRAVMGGQAGAGIDPGAGSKYCLEDLRYFYRQTPANATANMAALDLGDQITESSPRFEVAEDLIINGIKAGYANPQLTALNGGLEFNAGVTYGTKITATNQVLDIVCPINASCRAIEERRIQPGRNQPSNGLSGSFYLNSAASRSDNDNHFVYVKPAAEIGEDYYQPLTVGDGCIEFSGITAQDYNWMLSPKQNVLRGTNYLASVLDGMAGYTINITGADKNVNMVTVDLNGRRVSEGDPIQISDLGPQIFLPYYDNVVTGLQFNAEQMLRLNQFGEVWYLYRGVNWRGFIHEVSVDMGSNTPQTFKLLLTPTNDLRLREF